MSTIAKYTFVADAEPPATPEPTAADDTCTITSAKIQWHLIWTEAALCRSFMSIRLTHVRVLPQVQHSGGNRQAFLFPCTLVKLGITTAVIKTITFSLTETTGCS